jgi:hypothetical protein
MEHAPSAGGIIARQERGDAAEVKIYEYESEEAYGWQSHVSNFRLNRCRC